MVTILLPVYNGEKYIKKSIDSILSQDFGEFELIIGFNGTTDSSIEIVNSYNDPRIKVINYGEDKGKGKTLNKMLREARFDIIALQDDDDVWHPSKLSNQIDLISDFDIIGTQISYINEKDEQIGGVNLRRNHEDIVARMEDGDNNIANSSAIFKKSKAIEIGGWSEDMDGIEDFDFWVRMIKSGCRVKNIEKILVKHRIHSKSNFNVNKYDISKIIKK